MKPNEYKCAICKEVFKKGLTDSEAIVQLADEFPSMPVYQCDLVCDDCYKKEFGK